MRTPHVQVPVATHTGWNFRTGGSTQALYSIVGSFVPFAATAAQRLAAGDPRPSLAERYRSRHDYVARIALAASALAEARLLLDEDVDRYVGGAIAAPGFEQ